MSNAIRRESTPAQRPCQANENEVDSGVCPLSPAPDCGDSPLSPVALTARCDEVAQNGLAAAGDRVAVREEQRVEVLVQQWHQAFDDVGLDGLRVVAEVLVRRVADAAVVEDPVAEGQ